VLCTESQSDAQIKKIKKWVTNSQFLKPNENSSKFQDNTSTVQHFDRSYPMKTDISSRIAKPPSMHAELSTF